MPAPESKRLTEVGNRGHTESCGAPTKGPHYPPAHPVYKVKAPGPTAGRIDLANRQGGTGPGREKGFPICCKRSGPAWANAPTASVLLPLENHQAAGWPNDDEPRCVECPTRKCVGRLQRFLSRSRRTSNPAHLGGGPKLIVVDLLLLLGDQQHVCGPYSLAGGGGGGGVGRHLPFPADSYNPALEALPPAPGGAVPARILRRYPLSTTRTWWTLDPAPEASLPRHGHGDHGGQCGVRPKKWLNIPILYLAGELPNVMQADVATDVAGRQCSPFRTRRNRRDRRDHPRKRQKLRWNCVPGVVVPRPASASQVPGDRETWNQFEAAAMHPSRSKAHPFGAPVAHDPPSCL